MLKCLKLAPIARKCDQAIGALSPLRRDGDRKAKRAGTPEADLGIMDGADSEVGSNAIETGNSIQARRLDRRPDHWLTGLWPAPLGNAPPSSVDALRCEAVGAISRPLVHGAIELPCQVERVETAGSERPTSAFVGHGGLVIGAVCGVAYGSRMLTIFHSGTQGRRYWLGPESRYSANS